MKMSCKPARSRHIVGQVAALLWVGLAAFVIAFGYHRREELARLFTTVKLPGGIEFTFREQLNDAIADRQTPVPEASRTRVLRRAARDAVAARGARVLWVDDTPAGNLPERKLLRSLGLMIDLARTSDGGLDAFDRADYDLVISNMKREGSDDEGERFLRQIRAAGHTEPLVFYF
jgi:hypothetical protein